MSKEVRVLLWLPPAECGVPSSFVVADSRCLADKTTRAEFGDVCVATWIRNGADENEGGSS